MIYVIRFLDFLILSIYLYLIWNWLLTPVFPHITFLMSTGITSIFIFFSDSLISKNYNYLQNKK
jgi:hypothetical protein